jgi:hypothetical protein
MAPRDGFYVQQARGRLAHKKITAIFDTMLTFGINGIGEEIDSVFVTIWS